MPLRPVKYLTSLIEFCFLPQLSDFTISFNQEVDFGGSAPTTGKVTFNTLQVVKPIDFNTPPFLVKMASGKLWTGITLGIYQVSGTAGVSPFLQGSRLPVNLHLHPYSSLLKATPVMQYRLGEVAISGISTNSPTGNGLIEVVSFEVEFFCSRLKRIEITYLPHSSTKIVRRGYRNLPRYHREC